MGEGGGGGGAGSAVKSHKCLLSAPDQTGKLREDAEQSWAAKCSQQNKCCTSLLPSTTKSLWSFLAD